MWWVLSIVRWGTGVEGQLEIQPGHAPALQAQRKVSLGCNCPALGTVARARGPAGPLAGGLCVAVPFGLT